jgi:hypothetical protein
MVYRDLAFAPSNNTPITTYISRSEAESNHVFFVFVKNFRYKQCFEYVLIEYEIQDLNDNDRLATESYPKTLIIR